MKKALSVLVAAALSATAVAQSAAPAAAPAKEPKKTVISTFRVLPKSGHVNEFKAALSAHAKKYHQGDLGWRVGEVMSGPDSGMFQVNEGPTSWTALDGRGDLGAEHSADFDKNIMPHVERIGAENYASYLEDLSSAKLEAWSNKVLMLHYDIKPGKQGRAIDVMRRWKAIREKRGISFAVWISSWSGPPRMSVAVRLKNGWKDFDVDIMSNREAATAIWGASAWDALEADMAEAFAGTSSELVNYDPSLGSK